MTTREYEGDGIVVHWDSDRCFHSERCTTGLPQVFNRAHRPWVDTAAASAAQIAAVIDTCPSGALTYTRTDGAPNGRRGRGHDEEPAKSLEVDPAWRSHAAVPTGVAASTTPVTITPLKDGPLSVSGPVAIAMADGSVQVAQHWELCRCGHSSDKPRCDGSHARIGFSAPGVTPDGPTDA